MTTVYSNWEQINNLNTTDLPCAVSGLARSGTTYFYRNMAYFNLDRFIVEEYFNPYMEYKFNNDYNTVEIDIEKIISNNKRLTSFNADYIEEKLKNRIENIKHITYAGIYPKILHSQQFPLLYKYSNKYQEIIDSYFWYVVVRKNWQDVLLSILYMHHKNRPHYYANEPLNDAKFTVKEESIYSILNYIQEMYMHLTNQKHKKVIYMDEFSHLPAYDLSDKINNFKLPRHDKDKTEFIKSCITNYQQVIDISNKYMQTIEERTNGVIYLLGDNMLIKE